MLTGEQIAEADLTDWRKLGQGLHAGYLVGDFGTGVRFVAAVGEAGDALGQRAATARASARGPTVPPALVL